MFEHLDMCSFAGLSWCTCWIYVQLSDASSHPKNDSFPMNPSLHASPSLSAINLMRLICFILSCQYFCLPSLIGLRTYTHTSLFIWTSRLKSSFWNVEGSFSHKMTENTARVLSEIKHCCLFMQIIHSKILNKQLCNWGVILGIFVSGLTQFLPAIKHLCFTTDQTNREYLIHIHGNWTNKADKAQK